MPKLYVIAGPNGAGKTTFAREFLPHFVNCKNFINADLIAAGLSPFSPDESARRKKFFPLAVKAEKALKKAVRKTILEHQQRGAPLAIWQKGKVVWVPAEKLLRKRK